MTEGRKLDFAKLLGFEVLGEKVDGVNFRAETFGDKLGAKVGAVEPDGVSLFKHVGIAAKMGAKVGEVEPV